MSNGEFVTYDKFTRLEERLEAIEKNVCQRIDHVGEILNERLQATDTRMEARIEYTERSTTQRIAGLADRIHALEATGQLHNRRVAELETHNQNLAGQASGIRISATLVSWGITVLISVAMVLVLILV